MRVELYFSGYFLSYLALLQSFHFIAFTRTFNILLSVLSGGIGIRTDALQLLTELLEPRPLSCLEVGFCKLLNF